jgi:hypothetical protein
MSRRLLLPFLCFLELATNACQEQQPKDSTFELNLPATEGADEAVTKLRQVVVEAGGWLNNDPRASSIEASWPDGRKITGLITRLTPPLKLWVLCGSKKDNAKAFCQAIEQRYNATR